MKTIVKYMVLKDLDYQLGTLLFQEELQADALYFDQGRPKIFRVRYLRNGRP